MALQARADRPLDGRYGCRYRCTGHLKSMAKSRVAMKKGIERLREGSAGSAKSMTTCMTNSNSGFSNEPSGRWSDVV